MLENILNYMQVTENIASSGQPNASDTDKKVWVHCVKNYRASAFLYHYLHKSRNFSITEAQKAILPSWNRMKYGNGL